VLPAPAFYDPAAVGTVYVERAGIVAAEAERFRRAYAVRPASEDRFRVCAFGIDAQVGFCSPGASLFVPGAVEDTARAIAFLYRNLDAITELTFSLDTHHVFQIFHPSWWVDADGNPPPPFTVITTDDVRASVWRAAAPENQERAREYVERLEANGKYVLTVWPYHTLLGGVSHALVPALMEATMFHAIVRRTPPRFETKGSEPSTESYSVLAPEVRELGGERIGAFNQALLERLVAFDRVYVFGQAKSHCVLSTLKDLREQVERVDAKLLGKIWILEDATSPVPPPPLDPLPPSLDFPAVATAAFAELADAGMHVVKTSEPIRF
jgi:nicotinamidase-related amidase